MGHKGSIMVNDGQFLTELPDLMIPSATLDEDGRIRAHTCAYPSFL